MKILENSSRFADKKKALALIESESGQSMAEFSIIAITFFFVVLGVIQLAMVLNAFSLVRYAAHNAARAAIVHGGSPEKMREAARLSLVATFPRHGRADHRRGFTENYLGARDTDQNPLLTHQLKRITDVRIIGVDELSCDQTISFDDPQDAAQANITVQVVHQYELVIPLVNRLIYWLYDKLESGGTYEGETLDYVAAETNKRRRTGDYYDIEYRIPLVAHYTMRLQSDLYTGACPTTTTTTTTSTSTSTTTSSSSTTTSSTTTSTTSTTTSIHECPNITPPSGSFCGTLAGFVQCPPTGTCFIPAHLLVASCNSVCCFQCGPSSCFRYTCRGNTAGSLCYCN